MSGIMPTETTHEHKSHYSPLHKVDSETDQKLLGDNRPTVKIYEVDDRRSQCELELNNEDDKVVVEELTPSEEAPRAAWDNKLQYLLACISYAVGLGNVWRFPYLCQENGGGAFLIPYVIMMFLEGMPVFLLEMGIGQRLRTGSIGVWNEIHPYLGGVGISSSVISFLVALYYNVIITWCLFYLAHCFQDPLPWATCPMYETLNGTMVPVEECDRSSETAYFWYRRAIETTTNINDFGGVNWRMLLCLIAAWFIVWACVCKGIKTSGKVMYVTATFPYIVTTIFFIRSAMLPGADKGIAYMFTPQMGRLLDPRVWLDAATQIFYSMGLAFGGIIAFASYNPVKNNIKRDVLVLSGANLVTSLYTAFVIFCILGFKGQQNFEKCIKRQIDAIPTYTSLNSSDFDMQTMITLNNRNFSNSTLAELAPHVHHCDFQKILKDAGEGTGLAFIAFTQAMIEFPGAQFWAIMFFLMLLSLGLGSMFGTLEGVITSVYDLRLFTWMSKPVLTAIICGISCVFGMVFVTRAGEFWVKLFDSFSGSYALMAVAFFEVIGIVYVYGWRRFCDDIEFMTGSRPSLYWQLMWRFVAPLIMFVLFAACMIESIRFPPTYYAYDPIEAKTHDEPYPAWCFIVACFLICIAMVPVPLVMFVRYFKIWKLEPDIPVAVKKLNSTASTAYILRSQMSVGRVDSTSINVPQSNVVA